MAISRDLGRAVLNIVKPDGTNIIDAGISSLVGVGSALRSSLLTPPRATDKLKDGESKVSTDPNKPVTSVSRKLPSVIKNPLEQFASFSSMWTLACLTPKQFNNPMLYRNNDQIWNNSGYTNAAKKNVTSSVVFASGGRFDAERARTAHGAPEYYIQNFMMKTTVGANSKTGNSNAFKFEFDIFEPYSMGLLLQSFQVAARNAGYINYLDNAPYVLKLDFMGYDELGRLIKAVKSKYFVLRLTGIKFSVNEGGSTYKVEAVPYNQQGFSDAINTAYTDLKLMASTKGTVEEILSTGPESLQAVLNKIEAKSKEDGQVGIPDQYEIQFPQTSSAFRPANATPPGTQKATSTPGQPEKIVAQGTNTEVRTDFEVNDIGGSSLGFSQNSGGNMAFKKAGDQYDEKTGVVKRDNMTIDVKNRSFQFSQGQTLTQVINQVIVSSQYARDAVASAKNIKDGFIKWFRLDVQVELIEFDPIINDFAKKITYRVVPYYVHHTIFSNPSSTPIGYPKLLGKICKGYEYIYSGQNVDVLKFDIQINNLFFTGIQPGKPADSGLASSQDQKGVAESKPKETRTGSTGTAGAQVANLGRAKPKKTPEQLEAIKGGSGDTDTEKQVAEQFQKAFTESQAEMVTVNLEILGDTYWLVDSGTGNYFSPVSDPQAQVTDDGTMNYESGDVFIYLTFRTPIDINEETGLYNFPKGESPFTGIYRVTMCENVFSEGIFKQKLTCIRMPGQPADYADSPAELKAGLKADPANALSVKIGPEEKTKTTPTDNTPPTEFA